MRLREPMGGVRERIECEEVESSSAPERLYLAAEEVTRAGLASNILGARDGVVFEETPLLPAISPFASLFSAFTFISFINSQPVTQTKIPHTPNLFRIFLLYFNLNNLADYPCISI